MSSALWTNRVADGGSVGTTSGTASATALALRCRPSALAPKLYLGVLRAKFVALNAGSGPIANLNLPAMEPRICSWRLDLNSFSALSLWLGYSTSTCASDRPRARETFRPVWELACRSHPAAGPSAVRRSGGIRLCIVFRCVSMPPRALLGARAEAQPERRSLLPRSTCNRARTERYSAVLALVPVVAPQHVAHAFGAPAPARPVGGERGLVCSAQGLWQASDLYRPCLSCTILCRWSRVAIAHLRIALAAHHAQLWHAPMLSLARSTQSTVKALGTTGGVG